MGVCVCVYMCGTSSKEGDDLLSSCSSSYADLRRASSGSVTLSPVMEQLAGLLNQDVLLPPPTMSTIRESASSRQVQPLPRHACRRILSACLVRVVGVPFT
jgi:hypothetical protein